MTSRARQVAKMAESAKPLIRAVEIWQSADERLMLEKAFYGDETNSFKIRISSRDALDDEVLSKVLTSKKVEIWSDLSGSTIRTEESFGQLLTKSKLGLNAAIAIPAMPNGDVQAVILLLLSLHDEQKAAFELWEPNHLGVLSISSSLYQNVSRFARSSEAYRFSVLEGLPSKVFDEQRANLLPSLGTEHGFVRSKEASEASLSSALGVPILLADQSKAALLFLSSSNFPWVHVTEIWSVEKGKLILHQGLYTQHKDFERLSQDLSFETDGGIAAKVLACKNPILFDCQTPDVDFLRFRAAQKAGFSFALGIPIFSKGKICSVVVMMG